MMMTRVKRNWTALVRRTSTKCSTKVINDLDASRNHDIPRCTASDPSPIAVKQKIKKNAQTAKKAPRSKDCSHSERARIESELKSKVDEEYTAE